MPIVTILLAEQDPVVARSLSASLLSQTRSVKSVASFGDLQAAIAKLPADAVIADLETITLKEVADLCHEYGLPVICTHRVPDDEIWMAAIDAGASDVCVRSDVNAMIRAIANTPVVTRAQAA
jgi:DNA-binding response OmpR family regulator